ncbi:MAG: hypothetical protein ACT4PV_16090 [Planctomycetaceae bacterium]
MVTIAVVIAGAGLLGGLVSSFLANQFKLPKLDLQAGVFMPGWIGNAIVGAIAALVLWGLYGPLASAVVIGDGSEAVKASLRMADVAGALVTGLGGSKILAAEVDKRLLAKTNDNLTETVKELAKPKN